MLAAGHNTKIAVARPQFKAMRWLKSTRLGREILVAPSDESSSSGRLLVSAVVAEDDSSCVDSVGGVVGCVDVDVEVACCVDWDDDGV